MIVEPIPYSTRFKNYIQEIKNIYVYKEKIHIPFLVVVVGQACTLKCADCANLTPYAPTESKSYDQNKINKDLKKILEVAEIDLIQIQGGEPFCYSSLDKLLKELPTDQKIRIATNGTLIPTENVLNLLKERKAEVRVSDYGLPQYVEKVKNLVEKLKQKEIIYSLYHFTMRDGSWIDFGGRYMLSEKNKRIVDDRYWTCSFGRNCLTLEDSILGYCSRSTIAPKIQGYKYRRSDYLMLDKIQNKNIFRWYLVNYTYKKHPMKCCRYCHGMKGKMVKPAIQLQD